MLGKNGQTQHYLQSMFGLTSDREKEHTLLSTSQAVASTSIIFELVSFQNMCTATNIIISVNLMHARPNHTRPFALCLWLTSLKLNKELEEAEEEIQELREALQQAKAQAQAVEPKKKRCCTVM